MNELDFIVKTAYRYIEDEDDLLEDFVGENEFDRAFFYALSKIKKLSDFERIIDYLQKQTHISETEALEKGKGLTSYMDDRSINYRICIGYIAFIKESKYAKYNMVIKNE